MHPVIKNFERDFGQTVTIFTEKVSEPFDFHPACANFTHDDVLRFVQNPGTCREVCRSPRFSIVHGIWFVAFGSEHRKKRTNRR